MPMPFKLTPQVREAAYNMFTHYLETTPLAHGKLSFEGSLGTKITDADIVKIYFHAQAFAKMVMLINTQSKEVAWHGTVSQKARHVYEIEDILVYPQVVTGGSVNTNQVGYSNWLMALEPETFTKVRMQGHSHVNMGTSPSSVDLAHQAQIVEQLEDDMFYIFMIWNKSLDCYVRVFDASENLMYTDNEVAIDILTVASQPMGVSFKNMKAADILVACLAPQIMAFNADAAKLIAEPSAKSEADTTGKSKSASGSKGLGAAARKAKEARLSLDDNKLRSLGFNTKKELTEIKEHLCEMVAREEIFNDYLSLINAAITYKNCFCCQTQNVFLSGGDYYDCMFGGP